VILGTIRNSQLARPGATPRGGGLQAPTCLQGHLWDLRKTDEKNWGWGYPPPETTKLLSSYVNVECDTADCLGLSELVSEFVLKKKTAIVITIAGFLVLRRHQKPLSIKCYVGGVGSVVERRSLADGLSLSCARPAANGRPLTWVSRPLQVNQLGLLSLSSFRGR